MELLRRSIAQNPRKATERIRHNRTLALSGMSALEAQGQSKRTYVIKEMALGHNRTGTYLAFGLAEALDLMEAGEWYRAELTIALLLAALEQAAMEDWHWQTAWLLTHLPEPPFHLVNRAPDRASVRPFSKLADPAWVACAMQLTSDAARLQEARKRRPYGKGETDKDGKDQKSSKGDGRGKGE